MHERPMFMGNHAVLVRFSNGEPVVVDPLYVPATDGEDPFAWYHDLDEPQRDLAWAGCGCAVISALAALGLLVVLVRWLTR